MRLSSLAFILVALFMLSTSAHARPDQKQFEEDLAKLDSFNDTYGNSQLLNEEPQKLAEVLGQAEQVKNEVSQIASRWEAAMNDRNDQEARKIQFQLGAFERQFGLYENRINQFKQDAPTQISNHIAEATRMSDEAVAEKKPLFFTGGVRQRMKWADDKLKALAAVDPAAATPLREQYEALKVQLPAKEAQLKDSIIAANELPRDNYSGPDKAQVVKLVTDAWKENHPDAEILMVRIPGQQWKRDTRYTWRSSSKAFEKSDRSHLQGQLIVKSNDDPKLAIVHVVDLYKDHLSNDAINAVPWSDKDVPVENMILVEKVK